jgi:hypothetical protein
MASTETLPPSNDLIHPAVVAGETLKLENHKAAAVRCNGSFGLTSLDH